MDHAVLRESVLAVRSAGADTQVPEGENKFLVGIVYHTCDTVNDVDDVLWVRVTSVNELEVLIMELYS